MDKVTGFPSSFSIVKSGALSPTSTISATSFEGQRKPGIILWLKEYGRIRRGCAMLI
jgi:hypothetical protein